MSSAPDNLTEGHLFDPTTVPLKLGYVSSLAARFTLPPFTQLDGRAGWWQDRKRQWGDLGLRSYEGRDARTFAKRGSGGGGGMVERTDGFAQAATKKRFSKSTDDMDEVTQKILALSDGQSIFDPVLCEMAYRWFCPIGGSILDPFAGGSVRGLVAATLGRRYTGVDLSADQVAANEAQAEAFVGRHVFGAEVEPVWITGDSSEVLATPHVDDSLTVLRDDYDFVWSCPPYHDLEVYSDDPKDLSNMNWDGFCRAYSDIILYSIDRLADDRFAGFVVGEIRGPDGFYRHFIETTTDAFERAGAAYYNEAFLVSPAGTLPLRAAKQFVVSRKLGRTHQTVLIFCKGDPKKAAAACDPEAMVAYTAEHPEDKEPEVEGRETDLSGVGHG